MMPGINKKVGIDAIRNSVFNGFAHIIIFIGYPKPIEERGAIFPVWIFSCASIVIAMAAVVKLRRPEQNMWHRGLLFAGVVLGIAPLLALWKYAQLVPHDTFFFSIFLFSFLSIYWTRMYVLSPAMTARYDLSGASAKLGPYFLGSLGLYFVVHFLFIRYASDHMSTIRDSGSLHSFILRMEIGEYVIAALAVGFFYAMCSRLRVFPEE